MKMDLYELSLLCMGLQQRQYKVLDNYFTEEPISTANTFNYQSYYEYDKGSNWTYRN